MPKIGREAGRPSMNPHSRPPATDAANPQPARRLARDVRIALDLLRQGQRAAAEAAKVPAENTSLLIVLDDLAVISSDLALVELDLQGLVR